TALLAACSGNGGLPALGSGGVIETGVSGPSGGAPPTAALGSPATATADATAPGAEPEVLTLPRYAITGQPFAAVRSAKPPASAEAATSSSAQEQFSVVTLFYATNRSQLPNVPGNPGKPLSKNKTATGKLPSMPRFGHDRARHLTLGFAQVTVPNTKRATGSIKRPRQVTVLSVDISREQEDPRKHFTLGNLQVLDAASFYRMASAEGARPREYKDHAMVFVHGYNTTFDEAIYRTAQLTHDIGFDGVPYAFSWPSKGETLGYPYDRESADASHGHLADFIDLIAKRTTAKKIHIIAHSMGARLLVDALYPAKAPTSTAKSPKLGEIILAAADIDRSVLISRADSIKAAGKPVTLYVSNNDYALAASRQFSQSVPRVGDANEGEPLVLPGIETIDISDSGSLLASLGVGLGTTIGHTTFAEKSHVLTDMALMMRTSVHPPNRRFPVFTPIAGTGPDGGTYWRYVRN
ncbi:MAG: alpha/beta fold hydrolase, partial [Hyphomicrobiaceae bacterium]|nr:alpha/beta fold hydrolase [Hyphomicrobiaceae bacterium]